MSIALKANHLTKQYGHKCAIEDISLELRKGDIACLAGNKGAGKTTLLSLLCGLHKPTHGSVETPVGGSRIGVMLENEGLFPDLTIWENLMYAAKAKGVVGKRKRIEELCNYLDLGKYSDEKIKKCPYNSIAFTRLGAAILRFPDLVLLDEPFKNLDTNSAFRMKSILQKLNEEEKTTILFSDSSPSIGQTITTHYYIISQGRLAFSGDSASLESQCSDSILVETSTNDETVAILQDAFPKASISLLNTNNIEVKGVELKGIAQVLFDSRQKVLGLRQIEGGIGRYIEELDKVSADD